MKYEKIEFRKFFYLSHVLSHMLLLESKHTIHRMDTVTENNKMTGMNIK